MIEAMFKFVDKFLKWPPVINWRTTLAGIAALLAALADLAHAAATKTQPNWSDDWTAICGFFIGLMAKDHNTTGGSVSAVTGASGPPVSLIEEVKKI